MLFGENGVAAGLTAGKTVVDMSSISPIETKVFAARINALGCDYLDAPILRLGGAESPIPYNPELEKAAVPQVPGIIEGLRNLVRGRM